MVRAHFEISMLAFALLLGIGSLVWVRTATVKATYLFFQREKEIKRLQEEISTRQAEWFRLTSPQNLEGMAKRFGLTPPGLSQSLKWKTLP